MTELRVVVIIPCTLKSTQVAYLLDCVKSLQVQTVLAQLEVMVVSTAFPPPTLRKKLPNCRFLQVPAGSGFGEMNNFALKKINQTMKADWVLLLNDDAYLAKDFFAQLKKLTHQKQSPADIIAPLVFSAREPTQIDNFGVEYFRSGYAKNCRSLDLETTIASAGCLLFRQSFLKKLHQKYGFFFNPIYYFYLEDIDLTLRAKLIGAKLAKAEQLQAFHYGSSSSGGTKNPFSLYHTYRNILWVLIVCWPVRALLRNFLSILLVQAWVVVYSTLTHGPFLYPKILWETARHLPQLLGWRRRTISAYSPKVSFQAQLSRYAFRTYHNKIIPAL